MTVSPTALNSPEVVSARWRFLGHEIETDWLQATLPKGNGGPADLAVLCLRGAFPPLGELIRQFGGTPGTGPSISVWESPEGFQYTVDGVGRFWIERGGHNVWYQFAPGASSVDIDHLLAGPVLGLAFRERGHVMLHASAVMVGGAAIAFSAPHGAGKSTLGFSFAKSGYPLLSDDILGLRERAGHWRAVRSLPRVKLWGESLEALDEAPGAHSPTVSWLEKRRIELSDLLAPEELPLRAIYLLDPRTDVESVTFAPLTGAQVLLQLMASMYSPETLRGRHAATALLAAGALHESIPVRVVRYRRAFDNLPALREAILRDAGEVAR